jgi:hypothetical protein
MKEGFQEKRQIFRKAVCAGTCVTFALFSLGSSAPIAPSPEIALPKVLIEQQSDSKPRDKKISRT